jgi:hypothetical protein
MGLVLALDILQDVSFALVEPIVSTALSVGIAGGLTTVGVGSVAGLYPGAQIMVNRGGASQEVITLTAVGIGTITANFVSAHSAGEPLNGATFPSGQPDHPLFTLPEMLAYLLDLENDFLLKTRCIYATQLGIVLQNNVRFYPRPADAIRMERVVTSDGQTELKNTSQEGLDDYDFGWETKDTSTLSRLQWFEDSIGNSKFGINPVSDIGGAVNVWYSQKDIRTSLGIDSTLLVPDICAHALKYGVLARAFSKDGEQRDDFRAKYSQARFDMVVKLTNHFMKGMSLLLGDEQQQESEFKMLAVPAGVARG